MKLLMTADAMGGVWTYTVTLVRALAARGVQTTVATMGRRPDDGQREEIRAIAGTTLIESDFRLEWMDESLPDLDESGRWLMDVARQTGADLVHLNGYALAALPWERPTVVVAHSCVSSWWRAVHGVRAPASWDRYRRAVQRGLDAASVVCAPTRAMRDALHTEYTFRAPVCVIHNGVDGPARAADDAHRDTAGAPADHNVAKEPFVLSVGRLWDEAKNVRALHAAAPELALPIVVAGDADIKGSKARSRIAPRIAPRPDAGPPLRHLGQLSPEMTAEWMRRAAIYAHPARYEPFGLAVLEAARADCALVLADIPSLRELWDGAALFADPTDSRSIAITVNTMARSAALRADYAGRARARSRRYPTDTMTDRYLALYDSLTGGTAPGAPHQDMPCAS